MHKLKSVLSQEALIILYYALVHPLGPHLLHGIVAWGSAFPTYLNSLVSLQNKAVRVVDSGNYRDYNKFN